MSPSGRRRGRLRRGRRDPRRTRDRQNHVDGARPRVAAPSSRSRPRSTPRSNVGEVIAEIEPGDAPTIRTSRAESPPTAEDDPRKKTRRLLHDSSEASRRRRGSRRSPRRGKPVPTTGLAKTTARPKAAQPGRPATGRGTRPRPRARSTEPALTDASSRATCSIVRRRPTRARRRQGKEQSQIAGQAPSSAAVLPARGARHR